MKNIKVGDLVQVISRGGIVKGTGEVMGFERVAGVSKRYVVVRMLRTNEIVRVMDENLRPVERMS